jgi:UDP-GlcNAc:undecaprenyl-phosphate GlcNAc-1-phosphate transferase
VTDFFGGDALVNLRERLGPGLMPLLVAFAVCALVVPLMIWLSRRTGLIAEPGGRHPHSKPTPLLGGVAMYLGFAAALVIFLPNYRDTLGVLVVSGIATVLLIADDRWHVRPAIKLAFQLIIALVAIIVFGFKITSFTLPGEHLVTLGVLAAPITLFWLLGMQNTVNFLDGVDGLAAGVVFIVAVTLMLAAAGLRQVAFVQFAAALAGTCAGFLIFNFHPARIFMGDSGAHFLGAALGVISVVGVAKVAVAFALVVPVLALALPIVDTAWAILRRRREGTSVARPDAPAPPAPGVRAGPTPDLLRLLCRERSAGCHRAHALRPRADPRGGPRHVRGAGLDGRGGPPPEDRVEGARALPARPAALTRFQLEFGRACRPPRIHQQGLTWPESGCI